MWALEGNQFSGSVRWPFSGPPSSGSLYYLLVVYLVFFYNLNPMQAGVDSKYLVMLTMGGTILKHCPSREKILV